MRVRLHDGRTDPPALRPLLEALDLNVVAPGDDRGADIALWNLSTSPQAAASLSIWLSWAKHACTTPKPRMAPLGRLLVRTAQPSTVALSHAYGPWACVTPLTSTAGEVDAYAPPSNT